MSVRVQPRLLSVAAASDERPTPLEVFEPLNQEFGFKLDAAANAENTKCGRFYSIEDDGLSRDWENPTWCNPPYSETKLWVEKAYRESLRGVTSVLLLPVATDTRWFHDFVLGKSEIRWVKGRIKFVGGKDAAFASMVCIYRPEAAS